MNKIWRSDVLKNNIENELAKENGEVEYCDINKEDRLLDESAVGIKHYWNKDDDNEKGKKLGEKIIGALAKEITIVEAPKERWGKGYLDMLPGTFVDGSEETDDFVFVGPVIKKVSNSAENHDNYHSKPKNKNVIHGLIISWL